VPHRRPEAGPPLLQELPSLAPRRVTRLSSPLVWNAQFPVSLGLWCRATHDLTAPQMRLGPARSVTPLDWNALFPVSLGLWCRVTHDLAAPQVRFGPAPRPSIPLAPPARSVTPLLATPRARWR